jgi:hypothetical protein
MVTEIRHGALRLRHFIFIYLFIFLPGKAFWNRS